MAENVVWGEIGTILQASGGRVTIFICICKNLVSKINLSRFGTFHQQIKFSLNEMWYENNKMKIYILSKYNPAPSNYNY